MSKEKKDYEYLGRLVADGHYVRTSLCVIIAVLALALGGLGGYLLAPKGNDGSFKTPIAQEDFGNLPQNKQIFDAILSYENIIKEDPNNVDALVTLGHLYFDTNQPAQAISSYEKALEINPDLPDVWVDCGVMYRNQGKFDVAIKYMDKALELNSEHQFALFNSGVILHNDLKDDPGAFERWEKLLKINPEFKTPEGKLLSELIESHN